MLRYKDSSTIRFSSDKAILQPEIIVAMSEIAAIYYELEGKDFFITSIMDGKHMENSKHYDGKAFDGRTKNLTNPFLAVDIIRKRLNEKYPGIYKVLYESHGKPNAHIHVQLTR
jgi:hypothetical protein